MTMSTDHFGGSEQLLIERAQGGDESAYRDLVEVHRAEIHAHCYRMLGSVHDADDALQDAMLRAWQGLPRFEGRSSVRTWLYKIATNTALDIARRRSKRELPVDRGPAATPGEGFGAPVAESAWVGPYPDRELGDLELSPEARYERRESLELAFIAALQHLPPSQRAVLILREVLGFSAQEVAGQLDTSVQAVNSALQRARAATETRIPARSQQATLGSLGDERIRALAKRYVDAIERGDASVLVSMLTEDAVWSMPPLPTWYRGREAISEFLIQDVFSVRWRHLATRANGQLAVGCYTFDPDKGLFVASVLDVLTIDGERIAEVDGFLIAEQLEPSGQERRFIGPDVFPRFGLPAELPEADA
jgi:RNA polymerase sigma-70 factor (ECF subfamily)